MLRSNVVYKISHSHRINKHHNKIKFHNYIFYIIIIIIIINVNQHKVYYPEISTINSDKIYQKIAKINQKQKGALIQLKKK